MQRTWILNKLQVAGARKAAAYTRYESGTHALKAVLLRTLARILTFTLRIQHPLGSRINGEQLSERSLKVLEEGHTDLQGTYWQFRCSSPDSEPRPTQTPFPSVRSLGKRYLELENARVRPGASLVLTEDGFIFPELLDVPEWSVPAREWSPWDLHRYTLNGGTIIADGRDEDRQWTDWASTPAQLQLSSAVSLFDVMEHHYGHWLMDIIHRLPSAAAIPSDVPLIIGASTPPNIDWWITRVSPGRRIIRVASPSVVQVGRLYVPLERAWLWRNTPYNEDTSVVLPAKFDSCAFGEIQALTAAPRSQSCRSGRIWLRRDKVRPGHLANETELADFATQEMGFESVYPEDLSMEALVDKLDNAQTVVSSTGSHLANLMATAPGLDVLVLNGTTDYIAKTSGGFPRFCQTMGHRCVLLLGQTLNEDDVYDYAPFRVTTQQLSSALALLQDMGS